MTAARENLYLELVQRVPLRPIRSDEQLEQATALIDELIDRSDLDPAERDYLDVLSDLTHRYEAETVLIEPVSDAVLLAHLIEAKGVTQAELARETGIVESTISAVLAGKRKLNRIHIGRLSRFFNVAPTVFSFNG